MNITTQITPPAEAFTIAVPALLYDGDGRSFPVERLDTPDDDLDVGLLAEVVVLAGGLD